MNNEILKIALVGMDHRSMQTFRETLATTLKCRTEIVDLARSEITFIDLDSARSQQKWDACKSMFPNIPTLALSSANDYQISQPCISKPIDAYLLADNMRKLLPNRVKLWNQQLGFTENTSSNQTQVDVYRASLKQIASKKALADKIDTSLNGTTSILPERYNVSCVTTYSDIYDPDTYLYSLLSQFVAQAENTESFFKLSLWNDKQILFNPRDCRLYTDMSNGVLKSVCLTAFADIRSKVKIDYLDDNEFKQTLNASKWTAYDSETLRWLMAILSARGRIPKTLGGHAFSTSTPMYLRYWPNLTRLENIPHAQRMTTVWLKQARSVEDMAQTLGVDLSHALNFMIAAQAIGLAGVANHRKTRYSPRFKFSGMKTVGCFHPSC